MYKLIFITGIIATLSGCANSPPTAADFMRDEASAEHLRADDKSQIARDWDRGAKLVESGKKNLKEGNILIVSAEEDITTGRGQIELGNREIAEGRQLMLESERRFQEALAVPELERTTDTIAR